MSVTLTTEDLLDAEGFVTDPALWDRNLALALAAEAGVAELSALHWQAIDEVRANYLQHGQLLWMAHVCRKLGLDGDCIQRLFGGPLAVWKIAGLPNPGLEAKTYMANEEAD